MLGQFIFPLNGGLGILNYIIQNIIFYIILYSEYSIILLFGSGWQLMFVSA